MSDKIKWGVLGYARIAKKAVIPAILKTSNAEFYAIASRDREKAEECKKEFGCKKAYGSYDELLDDPEIQAVYIPLPNGFHKEWTIKAAQKGKHVLCEKPMALNTEECLEMIRVCEENQVNLMEAFMYRYTTRTQKVRELLDSGIIGDIKHIYSTFSFMMDRENDARMVEDIGGGSLYDVGCYPINFVGMITGKKPVSVSAKYEMKNGVDVLFSGVLGYDNGMIATINSGFNTFLRQYTEIVGAKGIMEIPDTFGDHAGTITITTAEGKQEIPVEKSERYVLEVEDFSAAILQNKKPMFSLEETVMNMKVIERLLALRK